VKFLALFLFMVVLTLTVMPCCASEAKEVHLHEIAKKEKHECADKDDDCCKKCSPFYVCDTCIGFTTTNLSILKFVVHFRPVQHNTIYIPVKISDISTPIWQPPKQTQYLSNVHSGYV